MATLAEAFRYGVGIPKDATRADQIRGTARGWLEAAAEGGDDEARLALGRIYMHGIQVPEDFARAEQLFLDGAKPENVVIRRFLGSLYRDKLKRHDDALRVFQALADDGDHGGMNHLRRMYYQGLGVPQDYQKAAYWAVQTAKLTGGGIVPNGLQPRILQGLIGGEVTPMPRGYVLALQVILKEEGYYDGPLDGEDTKAFSLLLSQYPEGPPE